MTIAEWQPIETAPRNGTVILLFFDRPLTANDIDGWTAFDELPCSMGWWESAYGWVVPFMESGSADSEGHYSTFYMGQISPLPVKPVKWMPIPEPPK